MTVNTDYLDSALTSLKRIEATADLDEPRFNALTKLLLEVDIAAGNVIQALKEIDETEPLRNEFEKWRRQ